MERERLSEMTSIGPSIISTIKNAMNDHDPSLVDNTPRLLEVLNSNRADKLHRLLMRKDGRGFTLLHLAAERNQPESLKCLLIKEGLSVVCSMHVSSSNVCMLHAG